MMNRRSLFKLALGAALAAAAEVWAPEVSKAAADLSRPPSSEKLDEILKDAYLDTTVQFLNQKTVLAAHFAKKDDLTILPLDR